MSNLISTVLYSFALSIRMNVGVFILGVLILKAIEMKVWRNIR